MDDRILVLELIAYIENNLVQNIGTKELVKYSGYSLNRLRQKFFKVTGDTPSGYVRKRRLTEAAKEILSGEKIINVCLKYGYSSQDNFTTSFRSYFGVTPKEIYTIDKKYKRFIQSLREVYNIMEIAGLKQPPFCSTLMGCVKGASDYFDLDLTAPMLFGLSGHTFLINIHKELCPSGPYVWKKDGFFRCLTNLGIAWKKDFHFDAESIKEERERSEKEMITALNEGALGILSYMEFQLVSGFDENGFSFILPWNGAPSECKRLTFSTWEECLKAQGFAGFHIIDKGEMNQDILVMLKDALTYGLELFRHPEKFQYEGYRIGYGAYENWISAIKDGHGSEHGNWWNGMVWSESRKMGYEFFMEVQEILENENSKAISGELAELCNILSKNLDQIKQKELEDNKKIKLINENLALEHQVENKMAQLLKELG